MNKLAIFGTGGFAKELLDLAVDQGYSDICFLEREVQQNTLLGFPVLAESVISSLNNVDFAIGIADPKIRKKIHESYPNLNYPTLVHSQASLGYGVLDLIKLNKGNVVAAGARITNSCRFGHFVIVSFNSTVGHDCVLEDYVSVMPGANISGCIWLKQGVYIGTNAAILPGESSEQMKCLGENSVIGAGSVVTRDLEPNKAYIGIPAKELNRD